MNDNRQPSANPLSYHVGMIKQVRIIKRSLTPSEVTFLYSQFAPTLKASSVVRSQYWVKGTGLTPTAPVSPSSDHATASSPSTIMVRILNPEPGTPNFETPTLNSEH